MSRTKCKTCKYAHNDSGNYYCCYILETEHRRPCPAGDACTVYEPDPTQPRRRGKANDRPV